MVRILLFSRGLRPWLHSTTDCPYLTILPERAAKIRQFSESTRPFSKKKNILTSFFVKEILTLVVCPDVLASVWCVYKSIIFTISFYLKR